MEISVIVGLVFILVRFVLIPVDILRPSSWLAWLESAIFAAGWVLIMPRAVRVLYQEEAFLLMLVASGLSFGLALLAYMRARYHWLAAVLLGLMWASVVFLVWGVLDYLIVTRYIR